MPNSFGSEAVLQVGDRAFTIHRLDVLAKKFPSSAQLPYSLKILLENLLRTEDGTAVTAEDIEALADWKPKAEPNREIAFTPSRVLLQDFTGVPAIVDLAAMRDAMVKLGGNPKRINPLQAVELVIDHSVQVDAFGNKNAFKENADLEFSRNSERYEFLRWGQTAFKNFRVVPPDTGIVHQVNLEYLARVVFTSNDQEGQGSKQERPMAYPDTLVGTDSHTTMINGLGVLGWGVGGIEAEAAMLGQPVSMLIPQVIGFKLHGELPEGTTATDLVLTVTQLLRRKGVVGKFVEFYGDGLSALSLADRATIANMAPEYGATCGIFPIDDETLRYLRLTGRPESLVKLVECYYKEQGLFRVDGAPEAHYTDTLELDLRTVEASLAGPTRPQDRVRLSDAKKSFQDALAMMQAKHQPKAAPKALERLKGEGGGQTSPDAQKSISHPPDSVRNLPIADAAGELDHGSVVIAAITSCTNTSNPSVLLAAGLLAKKAVERGLKSKPWVKTSLAPGSKAVTEYLQKADVMGALEDLGFFLVGYGCTTCIGNSGPLPPRISQAIDERDLMVAAVLSGNRNFEGRVHPEVRANYLASPPLVVAYALAGRMDIDLSHEPLGEDKNGKPVFLKDLWPTRAEILSALEKSVSADSFRKVYAEVFKGDEHWQKLEVPEGDIYAWSGDSTYVKHPPYFVDMGKTPAPVIDIKDARVLLLLGDSITTDHISPAGSIKKDGPAGKYLLEHGVAHADFNSYGSRRGNHEVMVRGTFANIRLRNQLAPGTEGGVTRHLPDGEQMSIYDASVKYEKEGVPLVVLAGKEYGSGSSRDWAAKGPKLLGVRAVIAESYERIHRSNLVGMGILPLQFGAGDSATSLGLTGEEVYDIVGIDHVLKNHQRELLVKAKRADGVVREFQATVRIDTPQEVLYYEHGGILQYVLRSLVQKSN
jgi:aconitate hydratase